MLDFIAIRADRTAHLRLQSLDDLFLRLCRHPVRLRGPLLVRPHRHALVRDLVRRRLHAPGPDVERRDQLRRRQRARGG